jgi:hypothetical protein
MRKGNEEGKQIQVAEGNFPEIINGVPLWVPTGRSRSEQVGTGRVEKSECRMAKSERNPKRQKRKGKDKPELNHGSQDDTDSH